jgi:hypothetical protein
MELEKQKPCSRAIKLVYIAIVTEIPVFLEGLRTER